MVSCVYRAFRGRLRDGCISSAIWVWGVMARNRMIEVEYTLETGAVLKDYMQSKNAGKTLQKLFNRLASNEFVHLGPISLETAGIVQVSTREMELH